MELWNLFKNRHKSYPEIDPGQFKVLQDKGGLDVRTPHELTEGAIPGYHMIDFFSADFREQVSRLEHHKTYLWYLLQWQSPWKGLCNNAVNGIFQSL